MTVPPSFHIFFTPLLCTECPKIYQKSVLHLLWYRFAVYLSRYSTDLQYILGHSVCYGVPIATLCCGPGLEKFLPLDPDPAPSVAIFRQSYQDRISARSFGSNVNLNHIYKKRRKFNNAEKALASKACEKISGGTFSLK